MSELAELEALPTIESAVIGAMFLDDNAAILALDLLQPKHFPTADAQITFRSIQKNTPERGTPDIRIVIDDLLTDPDANGAARWVHKSFQETVTPANQELYVKRLLRHYIEREEKAAAAILATVDSAEGKKIAYDRLSEVESIRQKIATPVAAARAPDSWDLADIVQEGEDEQVPELVCRLFCRPSTNIVFGPSSAGKSWAVMQLVLDAVMGGGAFLGHDELQILPFRELRDDKTERALYCYGTEDTRSRIKHRVRKLLKSGPHFDKEVPRGAFVIATPPGGLPIHDGHGRRWLEKKIEETGATLVVLDTIASLTAGGLDTNKAEQVAPFLAWINTMRMEKGITFFLVHHTRKGSTDGKKYDGAQADTMLGAQTWRALSDGCFMLDCQDGKTEDVTVRCVKAKDIPKTIPSFHVTFNPDTGRFRPLEEGEAPPEREKLGSGGRSSVFTLENVLALRTRHPDGFPWKNLPDLLGGKETTFRNHSQRLQSEMLNAGHVVIAGELKWGGA